MYGDSPIPHQAILNAQEIPPRRSQIDCDIPVTARIVWERDGEERIETVAYAYTRELALVRVSDPRSRFAGCWLTPADVRRR
ncbi:hypothetical protein [Puerhibacterium puerhi]|uniref:hypothetical protein n=1 Tax=Puerhibacterium puerhi TaxID=2692623 RepID=UPI001357F18E|nr:hypothetical protein [Puerhibacterium puerhi]